MKETEYGVFIFDENENNIALRWVWSCLIDLSFFGKIETIIRIIFEKPPKQVGCLSVKEGQQKALDLLEEMANRKKGN